jgi:CRISPR system Cascade subunit CasC
MEKFLELHVLQNYAPSNLNRDDTGAPKDCFFGGYRRARISSQCQKYAVRQYFRGLVGNNLLSPDSVGDRTRLIHKKLQDLLDERYKMPANESNRIIELALSSIDLTFKRDGEAVETQYLLFLAPEEIFRFAEIIHEHWAELNSIPNIEGEENAKAAGKKGRGKKSSPGMPGELKKKLGELFNDAMERGKTIDIALFGRMLADLPGKNQNAACQVAHALSTHRVEVEFDFFTAVDDLQPTEETGAGMMGTVEFNSACFYRYAVVDYRQLTNNLQKDGKLASRAVDAFTRGFICAEPGGKQNSFAAHNPPKFVMASVRRDSAPWNLANAFEIPVRPVMDSENGLGLTELSAQRLLGEAAALKKMYGFEGKCLFLNACQVEVGEAGDTLESLNDLVGRIVGELEA